MSITSDSAVDPSESVVRAPVAVVRRRRCSGGRKQGCHVAVEASARGRIRGRDRCALAGATRAIQVCIAKDSRRLKVVRRAVVAVTRRRCRRAGVGRREVARLAGAERRAGRREGSLGARRARRGAGPRGARA